jgi:hypothetical protein
MGLVWSAQDYDSPMGPRASALVTRVLPGFPAMGRLRTQDRILAVDDQTLDIPANAGQFTAMMRRYPAGHPLRLTIDRGGQIMDVVVPLANGEALANFYAAPEFRLHPPYREVWRQQRELLFRPLMVEPDR